MTKDIDEMRKHLEDQKIMEKISSQAEDISQSIVIFLAENFKDEAIPAVQLALMCSAAIVVANSKMGEDLFVDQMRHFYRRATAVLAKEKK